MINGCGHKQQLHTTPFIPTLQHVKSTPEGFELWFSRAEGKQVTVWTRANEQTTGTMAASDAPILVKTQEDIVEIRFAYIRLGEVKVLSPWTQLFRTQAPPYPTIHCKIVKNGTRFEWTSQEPPSYKSWYLHHGQGLRLGPISTDTRVHKTDRELENVFIEWHSAEVRSERIPLNCVH